MAQLVLMCRKTAHKDFSFMGLALVYDLNPPLWGELGHKRSHGGVGVQVATASPAQCRGKNVRKSLVLKMSNHTMCYKTTAVTMITDLPSLPHLAGDTRIWVFSRSPAAWWKSPALSELWRKFSHSLACLWPFWFETPSYSLCRNKLNWQYVKLAWLWDERGRHHHRVIVATC